MANTADQLEKIYLIKTDGAPATIAELQKINNLFASIAKNKRALNGEKGQVEDPAKLEQINTALEKLNTQEGELVTKKQSILDKAKQEISTNQQLIGSYEQLRSAIGGINSGNAGEISQTQQTGAITAVTDARQRLNDTLVKNAEAQSGVSAAILAGREYESQEAATVMTEAEAQEQLNAQYEATKVEVAELQAITNEFNAVRLKSNELSSEAVLQYNQEVTELTALSERLVEIGGQLNAVTAEQKANLTAFQEGRIGFTQYEANAVRLTEKQTLLRNEMSQVRINANATAKSMLANVDSMKELGLRLGILREQYRNLSAAERESAEGQELLTQIKTMDAEIKVLDASLGNHQRNVGNYAGVLGQATGVVGKFLSIIERMALRMVAMVVIFEAVTKAVEYFGKKLKEQEDGITEYDRKLEESTKALEAWNQKKEKQNQLLEGEFKDNLVISGDARDVAEAERQLKILEAQQETGRNALRDKEASKKIDLEIFNQQQQVTTLKKKQLQDEQDILKFAEADAYAHDQSGHQAAKLAAIEAQRLKITSQMKDLDAEFTANRLKFLREQEDKYNPYKVTKVHDLTAEQVAADKFNAEQLGKLREEQYKTDAEQQRLIFEDTKESLDKRLQAHKEYVNDLKLIALQEKDTEVTIAQETLKRINEIKGIKSSGKKLSPEQQKLLDEEVGFKAELERAVLARETALTNIDANAAKERKGIIQSDIKERLDAINQIKEQAAQDATESLAALQDRYNKGLITLKKYKELEKVEQDKAHIHELTLIKQYLETQIAAYEVAGRDASGLRNALSKVNVQLFDANAQLFDDTKKLTFDLGKFYKDLEATALDAARTIAEGWVAGQQRQIDKDDEAAKKVLDNQKAIALANAQSAAEKDSIEREYDQKTENLERIKFNRQKKLAETQLELEFAVASIKALNAGFDTGGIYGAIAAEALVALEYAAKLAVIEQQQFEHGGAVPVRGGEFGGNQHKNGGTKFSFAGRGYEAQVNELAIINANAARSGHTLNVTGTPRQIASAINSYGGGVVFAPGASLRRFDYGGTLGSSLPAPVFSSGYGGGGGSSAMDDFIRYTIQMNDATNRRIDNLRVTLNPNQVANSNREHEKYVELGRL